MIYVLIAIMNGWMAGKVLVDHDWFKVSVLIVYGLIQYWLGQKVAKNSLTRQR